VDEFKRKVDELAGLMAEFQLDEAKLEGDGWKVAFRARRASAPKTESHAAETHDEPLPTVAVVAPLPVEEEAEASGEPITSPMNGIYYSAASPTAPPFVREGDEVEEGQVIALIEAMKVFNEIVAPYDGTITRITARNSELVHADEPLMFIERT
jgi:acetyl-CoA carboxylase biotin carboxyl carrier protein